MKSNPFFPRGVGGGEDCDLFLYFIFLNIQPGILIVKITWSVWPCSKIQNLSSFFFFFFVWEIC